MSEDDTPTREEALAAAQNLDSMVYDAFQGVEEASDNADEAARTMSEIEGALEEVLRQAEHAKEQFRNVGPRDAFDALGEPHDLLDNEMGRFLRDVTDYLESIEDEEPGEHHDTLTIGDTEYEVWLTPIEEDFDQDTRDSVVDQYNSGASVQTIADDHDLSTDDVVTILSDYEEAKEAQEEGLETEHL